MTQYILPLFLFAFTFIHWGNAQSLVPVGSAGSKTFFAPIDNTPVGWPEGRRICERAGKVLAAVENQAEYQVVNQYLLQRIQDGNDPIVYLGGYRTSPGSSWKWAGSERSLTYERWAAGEPRDGYNCMYTVPSMEENNKESHWRSVDCDEDHAIAIPVCQS